MKKRHRYRVPKRFLCAALTAALICQLFGLPALGAEGTAGSGGCAHVHGESCGYIQAEEGTPCKHELGHHDESCGGLPDSGGPDVPAPIVAAAFDEPEPAAYEIIAGDELPALPETLQATDADGAPLTIEDVTWEAEGFDANTPGEYMFTAKLPEGYKAAPEIGAPQITVTVKEAMNTLDFTSFAVGNTVTVNGLNYNILSMPAGETHGTVEVGNNEGYTGNNLSIPAEITVSGDAQNDGAYNVVGISNGAFWKCASLTGTLTIPASIKSIGDVAFRGTDISGTLTIPASVTDIGDSAFSGCSGITGLELPANGNLKTIGGSAFKGTGIRGTLTIPAGVIDIDGLAFYGCSGITGLELPANGNLKTIGGSAFFETGISGTLTISASVTDIGGLAFSNCSGITGLELPQSGSLKTIGEYAFERTGISGTLTIPASAINISGFNGCAGITEIIFSESGNLKTIGISAFDGTGISGRLTIPKSVTSIDESAFSNCSGITGLELPANGNLKTIGKYAFMGTGISGTLTIPKNVTSIGMEAFYDLTGLTKLVLPESGSLKTIGDSAFERTGISGTLTIPASIKTIGMVAFGSCSKITVLVLPSSGSLSIDKSAFSDTGISGTLTIPAGVASIGERAFFKCGDITALVLPDSGSLSIGEMAFRLTGIKGTLTIPAGVTSIGEYAFSDTGISGTLTVSSSVKSIGNSAFINCGGITGLELPSSGSLSIGEYAFERTGISGTLTILKGVVSIGPRAFDSCTGITALDLSDFTGSIGEMAFLNCNSLAAVTFGQTAAPELPGKAFLNVKEEGTIYYPQGATGYEKLLAGGLAKWQLADFEPHTVTMGTATGGSATASQYTAQAGTVITVTAQPEGNYDFTKWTVSHSVTWVGGTNETSPVAKFTMPDGDVTVTPVFAKVRYDISGKVTINGNPATQKVPIKVQKVAIPLPAVYTDAGGNYKISGLGNGIYLLSVENFTMNGVTYNGSGSVQISNGDATLDIALKSSAVQKAVKFTGLTANGSATETTTELTMTFDTPVDLNKDQIAISGTGVTVTKGTLTDSDSKKTWTLTLTNIQIADSTSAAMKVKLNLPDTYVLTPTEKTVTVYQTAATVPGAPTDLKAEAGDKQVKLTWTAPASDGGSEITRYEVSMNGGTWKATGGTTTTYTVTGLTNGTEYTFQVRAVNEKGAGAASDEVKATPAAATYTLTVINGTDSTNKGPYIEGARVSIKADNAPAGYRFDKWVSLDGGRFENDQSAETIFIMPGADVKIEAIFIKKTDPGHSHTFDSTWSFDGNSHWHACTAGDGARSGQAAHTASNWMIDKPATETEAGSQYKECTVCHYVLLRETIAPTGPTYSLHTLEDPDTGVKVSGYFTNDAVLVVKDRLLHAKNTCDVCDDIRARQDKGELIVLFDIDLKSGGYTGDLDVQIPVDAKYNGQTVLLLHCKDKVLESRIVTVSGGIAKGTFSSLSPFAAAVRPGGAPAITGLPKDYALLVGQSVSWTPAPAGGTWSYGKNLLKMTKEGDTYTFKALKTGKATATYTVDGVPFTVNIAINSATIPQTGDLFDPRPYVLLMLAALAGCIVLLLYRKRNTKRHG
ncbi:leucine-rich repeat protein [[Clostridium] hylemonae]|uniref:leucine-rich repeat protein n=1 Tax=[Clostridium] hylemonae TaxID=89153 RepID=UPI001FCB791E|nr:leucine-rich repeat protein [[Clostridium] hylemonae]BDF03547.1 hypothetical protein CE91St63_06090 [[Clostridium] hylemonae]